MDCKSFRSNLGICPSEDGVILTEPEDLANTFVASDPGADTGWYLNVRSSVTSVTR